MIIKCELILKQKKVDNFVNFSSFELMVNYQYTGLPTKDTTSETTVRNLYFLFP